MNTSFPDDNIDPRKKTKTWGTAWCKAAWQESAEQCKQMFYHYARQYDNIKYYALGKQDTTKYKKPMHIDEKTNSSVAVLDFKVLPIVKKHRQLALGRLQKSQYNIIATPVDALARDEADRYFAKAAAKIVLREQMQKQNPQLAQSPVLQPEVSEPLDMEELQLQKEYGFKHDYAIAAEEGIDLIFYQNEITDCRNKVLEDLFDWGVGLYKDWMDESGKVRFRRCDVRSIITNRCHYSNFKDLRYCGEVMDMTWNDFREQASGEFSDAEFEEIYKASMNQLGLTSYTYGNNVMTDEKFKVKVLDLEWFSVDEYVYEDKINTKGNPVFGKTDYKNKGKANTLAKKRKVIYKGKWVVGTDFLYDYGLASYMKRDKGLTNTELSYHVVATNFHNMTASGVMEDIIPIADQMAIAWLKLQTIRNELMPYYVEINLDALEDVDLGKGGEQLSVLQLLTQWQQNGILLTRPKGLSAQNPNYKTIQFVETNYGRAIEEAWADFNNFKQLLSEATGFNEATDGSTINPKNLNSTNEAMQESTNNALYHIVYAEEQLILKLANAVLCRLKRAVKMGKVEGYKPALGDSIIQYIAVSPDIDDHDYGLMIENKPSIEQKQFLMQEMSKYIMDGTLEAIDAFVVENCRNLKQAEKILALRINRRKAEHQQNALQQQQQTGNIQMQSAQAAEQAKQQTLQVEYKLKIDLMNTQKAWDFKIAELNNHLKANQTIAQIESDERMQDKDASAEAQGQGQGQPAQGQPPLPNQTPVPLMDNDGDEG